MNVPARVVSLVPSLTELVWALGAQERLVGRTRFCTEPADMRLFVPEYGGTKNPDVAGISALRPDLIIANKEENRKEDIETLRALGLRVVVTDPSTVRGALDTILQLGVLLGCEEAARTMHSDISRELTTFPEAEGPRVFVPIWRQPLMAMGGDCYGNDVLRAAGGVNVFADRPRYPEVTREAIIAARPDVILLPDEPYHFSEKHIAEFEDIAQTRVVSGQLLWWYGPRIGSSIVELRELLQGRGRP